MKLTMNLTFTTLLLTAISLGSSLNPMLVTGATQDGNQGKIGTSRAVESEELLIDPQDAWLKDSGQDDQTLFAPATHNLKGAYTLSSDPREFVVINLGYVSADVRIQIDVVTMEGNPDPIAFLDMPDISPNGGTFWFDDDSGVGLNPRIVLRTVEAGTYILRIKDLRGRGGRVNVDISYSL